MTIIYTINKYYFMQQDKFCELNLIFYVFTFIRVIYMKYFLLVPLLFLFLAVCICYAQTNVIKSTNIPRSNNSASSIINNRVHKNAEINKIDNELNMYKGKPDGYSTQKAMELEKQKIDVRNK